MQSGGTWDPVTGNVYGATGDLFWTTQNVKFLNAYASTCNATAFNPATLRVYASCFFGMTGGTATTIATIPNYGILSFDGGDPAVQTRAGRGPRPPMVFAMQNAYAQPTGLAVNPNTNRVYAAAATSPTTLDVIDGSTNAVVASIPGLPDQSSDLLVAGIYPVPLPPDMLMQEIKTGNRFPLRCRVTACPWRRS